MKKYIRLYRSSGSDPPVVVHDHVAEFYGLHDGDTVPHDLLPAVLDDCRKLNEMFYEVETAKKRGEAMMAINVFYSGDPVKILSGPHKGKVGIVLAAPRNGLYLVDLKSGQHAGAYHQAALEHMKPAGE